MTMLDLSKNSNTSSKDPYLIFNWQQNYFAISINYVREVMNYVTPTPLPRYPNLLTGIISLRGEICPVLNIRELFIEVQKSIIQSKKLIVVQFKGFKIIFDVDELCGIHNIQEDYDNSSIEESLFNRKFYTDEFSGLIMDVPDLWEFSLKLINE